MGGRWRSAAHVSAGRGRHPRHGRLMGSRHGRLMGSRHGRLMGSRHGRLMGGRHGRLMGSRHGRLMGSSHGRLMGGPADMGGSWAGQQRLVYRSASRAWCVSGSRQHKASKSFQSLRLHSSCVL
jgi:hypothetical protein